MVSRPAKRRHDGGEHDEHDDDHGADVDLGAPEHAWWAQRSTEHLWTPRAEPPPDDRPPRDVLAEHFGPDWRTSFGFDASADVDSEAATDADAPEPAPVEEADPYVVLGVAEAASWDEIVAAHRSLARAHHPDLVAQRPEQERADADQRIRQINIAYQELRVRRAR
jgi:hypothetical protein